MLQGLHAGVRHGFSSMHGTPCTAVMVLVMHVQKAVIGQCYVSHITAARGGGGDSLMDFVKVANIGKLFAADMRQGSLRCLCIRPVRLNTKGPRAGVQGGSLRWGVQVSLQHASIWSLPHHMNRQVMLLALEQVAWVLVRKS